MQIMTENELVQQFGLHQVVIDNGIFNLNLSNANGLNIVYICICVLLLLYIIILC